MMAEDLEFIAPTPQMAPILSEIHAEAFARPWSADQILELMRGFGAFTLAASMSGELQGFIIARSLSGEAEIMTLAVRPVARRLGLGRSLVEAAVSTAGARGAEALWLEVAMDNPAAIDLYVSLGFTDSGRRPHYYTRGGGERVDAVVMRCHLTPP